jgi:hypothetical protein
VTVNTVSPMHPGELPADYRDRLALERAEADERRRAELADLSSHVHAPEVRIRAWERAHGLTLPRDADHPVLRSVAAATKLSLEQVREEQRRRLLPAAAPVPLPA